MDRDRVLKHVIGAALAVALLAGISPAEALGATTISGTVDEWGTDGTPLEGVKIEVFDAQDARGGTRTVLGSALTDASGAYSVSGLTDGVPVIIAFEDLTDTYRDMTAPSRGLLLEQSFSFMTDGSEIVADCSLISLENLLWYRTYRVAGPTRYETAVQISRNNFRAADTVIIASGVSFPDALAASPLAGAYDAPMLLTQPTVLPSAVGAEIQRLGATKAFVIGSTSAVSNAVLTQLSARGVTDIVRVGGANRYATAEQIIYALPSSYFDGGALPFVCRGDNFADALAASPFAYYDGFPILLTKPTSLPAETARAWQYMVDRGSDAVLAIGSEAAVSNTVLNSMAAAVPGGDLYGTRIAGANRYDTASQVATFWEYRFDFLGMANGGNFPDALAGGAGIGRWGGALVLTPTTYLHPNAAYTVWVNRMFVIDLQCYGGESALSDNACIEAIIEMEDYFYDINAGYVKLTEVTPLSNALARGTTVSPGLTTTAAQKPASDPRPKFTKADAASKFTMLATTP